MIKDDDQATGACRSLTEPKILWSLEEVAGGEAVPGFSFCTLALTGAFLAMVEDVVQEGALTNLLALLWSWAEL